MLTNLVLQLVFFFLVVDILFIEIEVIEYFNIATHRLRPAFITVLTDPFCRVSKVLLLLLLLSIIIIIIIHTFSPDAPRVHIEPA